MPDLELGGYLSGVTAAGNSGDDVWAVGHYILHDGYKTLVEHWDGGTWSIVPSPNLPSRTNFLESVTAIAPDNIWAVGWAQDSDSRLIMHWDGTAWSLVDNTGALPYDKLYSVAATGPNDIWAVGETNSSNDLGLVMPLSLHWDGQSWQEISFPAKDQGAHLYSVAAVAPDDVWATGCYCYSDNPDYKYRSLVAHWDGRQWSASPGLDSGKEDAAFLYAVTSFGSDNVWAVGSEGVGMGAVETLIQHWDGNQWVRVPSPNSGDVNWLRGVGGSGPSDIWAVGNSGGPFTLHWDGTAWSHIASSTIDRSEALEDVVALSDGHFIAVGAWNYSRGTLASEYIRSSCP